MKKFFVKIGIVAFLVLFFVVIQNREKKIEPLVYQDNLDRVIVTADGRAFTLRDLSFYTGFQASSRQAY